MAGAVADGGSPPHTGWRRLDGAAFGIIYGAILVLSILLAQGDHPTPPLETALVLFGSVLAMTLAKTFAEVVSQALDARARATRDSWRRAWRHSAPTLSVANLPTAFFLAAWPGWIAPETALVLSQGVCVTLLAVLGARAAWVVAPRILPATLGAVAAGGIGSLLSVVKHVIH